MGGIFRGASEQTSLPRPADCLRTKKSGKSYSSKTAKQQDQMQPGRCTKSGHRYIRDDAFPLIMKIYNGRKTRSRRNGRREITLPKKGDRSLCSNYISNTAVDPHLSHHQADLLQIRSSRRASSWSSHWNGTCHFTSILQTMRKHSTA